MLPRNNGYTIHSLRFSTLLQLDNFEEKLLLARHEMNLRPATILRDRRYGEVRCVVEGPAREEPAEVSAEAEKFMAQLRQRQIVRLRESANRVS